MLGIVTSPGPFDAAAAMAERLAAVDTSVVSVVRSIRASADTSAPLQQTTLLRGQDHITETIGGLRFGIGVETFFQPTRCRPNVWWPWCASWLATDPGR